MSAAVDKVNGTLGILKHDVAYEVWKWETDAYPGLHAEGPQGHIDNQVSFESLDLVIGVFWNRFGTPTAQAGSGTEHELRKAYALWQQHGRPQMMVYFNEAPSVLTNTEELRQRQGVLEFKKEFADNGLLCSYNGPKDFKDAIERHLTQFAFDLIHNSDEVAAAVAIKFPPVVVRSEGLTELIDDIVITPSTSLSTENSDLWLQLFCN